MGNHFHVVMPSCPEGADLTAYMALAYVWLLLSLGLVTHIYMLQRGSPSVTIYISLLPICSKWLLTFHQKGTLLKCLCFTLCINLSFECLNLIPNMLCIGRIVSVLFGWISVEIWAILFHKQREILLVNICLEGWISSTCTVYLIYKRDVKYQRTFAS